MTKIEELKAAYEAATPGPWAAENNLSTHYVLCGANDDSDAIANLSGAGARDGANTNFIALAHNMTPQLLEVARWATAHEEWVRTCFPEYVNVEVHNELRNALEGLK